MLRTASAGLYLALLYKMEYLLSRLKTHDEHHLIKRIGWLRAAVLGANDGIISTASLLVGVASAAASAHDILVVGVSGLVAGGMSMAAGEYVSVSSQSDIEQSDLSRERKEMADNSVSELDELTQIYIDRGLDVSLAKQVSVQLMNKDALGAHVRDELGISDTTSAQPIVAAVTSAAMFSVGAILPLMAALVSPESYLIPVVSISSLGFLGLLGVIGAKAGGAPVIKAMLRVIFWGSMALALTAGIGAVFGEKLS